MLYWFECYGFGAMGITLLVLVALMRMSATDSGGWLWAEKWQAVRSVFPKRRVVRVTAVAKELPVEQPQPDHVVDHFFAEGQRLRQQENKWVK